MHLIDIYSKNRPIIYSIISTCQRLKPTRWGKLEITNTYKHRLNISQCFMILKSSFNTTVDIKLRHWAEKQLPKKCVDVGTHTLMQEFEKLVTKDNTKKSHDNLLDEVKLAVKESSSKNHQWDNKAMDSLVYLTNLQSCLKISFNLNKFSELFKQMH